MVTKSILELEIHELLAPGTPGNQSVYSGVHTAPHFLLAPARLVCQQGHLFISGAFSKEGAGLG